MASKQPAARAGMAGDARRRRRPRPTPKWLKRTASLDAIARNRCLMVLSVLSGERPVSEAVAQAKISRPAYYQLETRALKAMLEAMNPQAPSARGPARELAAARAQVQVLQAKLQQLKRENRRTQRLLRWARKSFWASLQMRRPGRPPKDAGSMRPGKRSWRGSGAKASPSEASMPMKAGESVP